MEKSAINRVISLLLVMLLVFTQMPFTALAESGVTERDSGCTHVCDDGTCAYVEGAECTYVCDDGLCDYAKAVPYDHGHNENCAEFCEHDCGDGSCAYAAGAACNHICDKEVCDYIKAVPCDHEHDENCGEPSTTNPATPIGAVTITAFRSLGANTFAINVTAEDGATIKTYTIVITRESSGSSGGGGGSGGGTTQTQTDKGATSTITGDVNGENITIKQNNETGTVSTEVTASNAQKAVEMAKTTGEVVITIPKTDTITSETPVEDAI